MSMTLLTRTASDQTRCFPSLRIAKVWSGLVQPKAWTVSIRNEIRSLTIPRMNPTRIALAPTECMPSMRMATVNYGLAHPSAWIALTGRPVCSHTTVQIPKPLGLWAGIRWPPSMKIIEAIYGSVHPRADWIALIRKPKPLHIFVMIQKLRTA